MAHVFAIGLNKTGTTSLTKALAVLGLRARHNDPDVETAMRRAHAAGEPLLAHAPEADAYLDTRAVERWFDLLDEQYGGSRFVLTTRDLGGWLDSREKHVLRNQERAAEGTYSGDWLVVDRPGWTDEWHSHHERARRHFSGRDDYLEMDFTRGDGWEALAPFLDHPIPNTEFPWLHRAPARTTGDRISRRFQRSRSAIAEIVSRPAKG